MHARVRVHRVTLTRVVHTPRIRTQTHSERHVQLPRLNCTATRRPSAPPRLHVLAHCVSRSSAVFICRPCCSTIGTEAATTDCTSTHKHSDPLAAAKSVASTRRGARQIQTTVQNVVCMSAAAAGALQLKVQQLELASGHLLARGKCRCGTPVSGNRLCYGKTVDDEAGA